jgi:hypothetical protein
VPISINNGTPITVSTPGHPVSQAIVGFARQRLVAAAEEPAPRRLGRRRR